MKKYFDVIKKNPLFKGIECDQFKTMLSCIQGNVQKYKKGGIILLTGTPVHNIGVVLSGSVQVLLESSSGRQNLLTEVYIGELFGEVFACAGIADSPVTVMASEDTQVLHLNFRKIITTCSAACVFHQRLIENMLTLVARKNLTLNKKIDILSKRTTRARLFQFFEYHCHGSARFTLPFNREELAAYLCVDRSALSAELSRMQKDGLIRYHRNEVELITNRLNENL